MADKAHIAVDKKLAVMEKRISAIYSEAQEDLQKKADKYFKQFEEDDQKKRKLVEQGKLTEDEYKKWRKGKVATGKGFTAMKEQVAENLLHTNEIAIAYINGEIPDVYTLGYNALAPTVEGIGSYSFTLVDADTVRNLATTDTSLLPYKKLNPAKDIAWNMQKINAQVTQGILQGESIPKIAKRISNVQEMNRASSVRTARTIVTGAENKGRMDSYKRAEEDGIILQKEWLSSNQPGRTRDWHFPNSFDKLTVDTDKPFVNGMGEIMFPGDSSAKPANVYNCFVGETKIASDSDVIRSYKHNYSGKIISIKTACGVQFSCTPNHPILTPNGWVCAELLKNGDNIIVTFGEQNVFGRVNPNINNRFPRIDTIHKLGKKTRGQRTCSLSVDFHGDVPTSDVEIITHKRLLRKTFNSTRGNCVNKFLFKHSNKTLSCFGSFFKHFRGICKSSFSFICGEHKPLSFFGGSLSHSCKHRSRPITNRDVVLTEYSIKDLPADTVIDGELLDRLSCKVFLDTVINVDVSISNCHVYNLQTENGYYFVNSIIQQDNEKVNGIFAIAKNCRCSMRAVVKGFKKAQIEKVMEEKQEYTQAEQEEFATLQKKYKNKTEVMLFGTEEEIVRYDYLLQKDKANAGKFDYYKQFKHQNITESKLNSWYTQPTTVQRDAISTYSSSGYVEMNQHLRFDNFAREKTKKEISDLHEFLEGSTVEDTIYLKRGINKPTLDKIFGNESWRKGENSIVGSVFTDKGFVSATPFEGGGFGGDVVMYIKAPKGTKGAYIKDFAVSKAEKEFLLQSNTSFVVRNVVKEIDKWGDPRYKVFAEVIV